MSGNAVDPLVRLTAVADIQNLRGRYWRMADTKQWEEYGNLFAPDGTFTDHAANFHCVGREEVARKIGDVLSNCDTIHHGHQCEIYVDDETHARGIWYLEDYLVFAAGQDDVNNPYPSSSVKLFGHYYDEYVKLDGEWKFHSINLWRTRIEQFTPTVLVKNYPDELRQPYPPVLRAESRWQG